MSREVYVKPKKIDIAAIDREISALDEDMKKLQAMSQRRNDLLNLKLIAQRLWGESDSVAAQTVAATPHHGNGNGTHQTPTPTIAGMAFGVLATKGSMSISQLLKAMLDAGWNGSGNADKDKKRIYSAIYKKPQFKLEDGIWEVTDVK